MPDARAFSALLAAALTCTLALPALAAAERKIVFEQPMCAGISGLRLFWDRPVVLTADGASREEARGNTLKGTMAVWGSELEWHSGHQHWMEVVDAKYQAKPVDPAPGAIAFDAVHRSLLVRFPGLAERVAAELTRGGTITRVVIHLPYRGTERMSQGYLAPASFIGDLWDKHEPRWHAVAWRLRRPWSADPQQGPTFNGAVHGKVSWTQYGAQDEQHDRFPHQLGPVEVSHERSEPLDITALLTDSAYGATLGERLRGLEDCGVLVRKLEFYDMHFETPGYEWAVMTGGRGILLETPRLEVTVSDGPAQTVALPPASDPTANASWQPTAVLPDAERFAALKERYAFRKPAHMSDWQFQRLQQLFDLGGHANTFPDDMRGYYKWVDEILRLPPRAWRGFEAADQLALFYTFEQAFPAPVVDHLRLYWQAWLMPHRATKDFVHNQYHQIFTPYRGFGSAYVDRTGDWRGNKSFYRESYTRLMSTMNFNHTAALGALLGGKVIGSEHAMADGRYGMEMFPLRLWAWYDGTTQESLDHYYFSHTLTAQKMVADDGPTLFDRMMGESCLVKSIEELAACYHPQLRRFVSTGGRTGIAYALAKHEGVGFIVHSLSRKGALTDLDTKTIATIPTVGHDFPPRRVAAQALRTPWGPEWATDLIDNKPLPFAMTATFKQWGAFREPTKWKKSYLGRHYGVASFDANGGTQPQMAIWNRRAEPATTAADIGMLTMRFGFNRTNMLDTLHVAPNGSTNANGLLGEQGGCTSALQHEGTMVVLASPYPQLKSSADLKPEKTAITSIQSTIMLASVQESPTWTIFADGKPIGELPVRLPASSRITIQDGVTFIGLVPLAATALGERDAEIELRTGGDPVRLQGGGEMRETLLIENLHFRSTTPFDQTAADWAAVDAASSGFVIVLGDASESDFAAFQRRIAAGVLSDAWDAAQATRAVTWRDGDAVIELGFRPQQGDGPTVNQDPQKYFAWRRVNGAWPYLAPGMERDTTLSCMGRTGQLQKNGATLDHEPDMMGYLVADPAHGHYMIANPLPDLAYQRFTGPDGLRVEADGKVGICTVTIGVPTRTLEVAHAVAPGAHGDEIATTVLVSGFHPERVVVNREVLAPPYAMVDIDGQQWLAIPLDAQAGSATDLAARVARARAAADQAFLGTAETARPYLRYEPGKEHYLLTRPQPGVVRMLRQWQDGTAFVAGVPGGPEITADGRVALREITIDTTTHAVAIDAPRYLQEASSDAMRVKDKASVFVITAEREPTVTINGEPQAATRTLTLDGRTAWVLPVPGGNDARDDAAIIQGVAAMRALATKE